MSHCQLDPDRDPLDISLQHFERLPGYARSGRLPWRRMEDGCAAELRRPPASTERGFPLRAIAHVPARRFDTILQLRFRAELLDHAIKGLHRSAPQDSALRLLNARQKALIAGLALAGAFLFATFPLATLVAFNAAATAYFLIAVIFRLLLAAVAILNDEQPDEPPPLADENLPPVTILLPVHDEADGLATLAAAIHALDYPPAKIDAKLILEEDDAATRAEAERLGLAHRFDIVIVPASEPKTKPKACNFALPLARGELIVIYDAEDAPEPDQLRKAAAAFAAGDEQLACLQARLNYYNASQNWLTRLFALEYALWFDLFLPALERLRMPIPLGGTSNIFRTDVLRKLGGWDPFNVTEDADLGLRLARHGYRTAILPSTTYEEANCRTGNWIRQRSRWLKGYMQTWTVHMRAPVAFLKSAGLRGFLGVQLFIAGNVFSALINPLLWGVFLYWLAFRPGFVGALFPEPLLTFNLIAFLAGNALLIFLAAAAPLKRGWPELTPAALLSPFYWALTSIAAYKALFQLVTRPHFWEKTDHMLSPAARARRAEALVRLGPSS